MCTMYMYGTLYACGCMYKAHVHQDLDVIEFLYMMYIHCKIETNSMGFHGMLQYGQ